MKLTKEEIRLYRKIRANPCSMLVGRDAEMAARNARIIARFNDLESRGVVRISSDEEQESYFSVYGKPDSEKERKSILETIERLGCVYVFTEWFDGEEWHHADSIGMCIYEDAESPFENCYVVDLMSAAIDQIEAHWAEIDRFAASQGWV